LFKSILVPIAPGRRCPHLARAVSLARRGGAEIVILRVGPHAEQSADGDLEDAQRIAMEDAPDIPVRSLVIDGDASHEIVNVARRERADLIVMGLDQKWRIKRGGDQERNFRKFLLKSTAVAVVQHAPCPVWLEKASVSTDMGMSCLVCVLGLRGNCEGLLKYAARIAEEYETRMVLFHSTVSARIFGPNQSRNVIELQRNLIETAEREIDRLQTRCSTSATKVVTAGNDMQSLSNTLTASGSELVVIDRVSDRWGDNNKIYEIIGCCESPVLVRVDIKTDHAPVRNTRRVVGPRMSPVVLLASMAVGISLIYLIMYLAVHTDLCHFAAIRCQTPADLLFPSGQRPSSRPLSPLDRRDNE
jgi:nucleotide-binding universal stress UspA family protein